MDRTVLQHCLHSAFCGVMTFPETVQRLGADGVEWYLADLVARRKTHYAADGDTIAVPFPTLSAPAIPEEFSIQGVVDALHAIQAQQIDYAEFLRRIMAAGTVFYTVHLMGGRAIYVGMRGDMHIQQFAPISQ